MKYGIAIGGSVGVGFEMLAGTSQVGVGSRVSIGVGPEYGVIPGSISGVRSSVGYKDSYAVALGQGVGSVTFDESVGHGTVGLGSAVGVGALPVVVRSVLAAVVGVAVGRDVVAFVDGTEVVGAVVEGRGVVSRIVGEVVARGACVAFFDTIVEVVSTGRPATVGRVVRADVGAEEASTVWDAPQVGAGEAA